MADPFAPHTAGLESPARDALGVTPHDSTNLTTLPRALWVGGAGNVACEMPAGNTVIFVGVPAGTMLPVRPKRVNATSTTATSIVAVW